MIVIIDNYDSFVYNLADYVARLNIQTHVIRNDAITPAQILEQKPIGIIISPGPCAPQQAGISIEVVKQCGAHIPILGVCLGHQAIGEAYGGRTIKAQNPVHGKSSNVNHDGGGLFLNIPTPMQAGRYHSLIVELPENSPLRVTAENEAGEIMAVQHTHHPVYGVQFHPESILTPHGLNLIQNFIICAKDWHSEQRR